MKRRAATTTKAGVPGHPPAGSGTGGPEPAGPHKHACEHEYTVLYYKRKTNKVHRSRGVSKLDGTLSLAGPGGSGTGAPTATLRSSDTDRVVFKGAFRGRAREDGERGAPLPGLVLRADETVAVGPYEVEILSRDDRGSGKSSSNATTNNSNNNYNNNNNSISSRKPIPLMGRDPNRIRIGKRSTNKPGVQRSGISGMRRGLLGTKRPLADALRKPPLQPGGSSTARAGGSRGSGENDDDDNDDSGNDGHTHGETTPFSSPARRFPLPPRAGPNARLPGFRRPGRTASGLGKTRPGPSSRAGTATAAPTGNASPSLFPGAVGNPVVPHSISSRLRPHQVEGVEFLWNCLTGNGAVGERSPHVGGEGAQRASTRGCILGDGRWLRRVRPLTREFFATRPSLAVWFPTATRSGTPEMGLGKTLMTIATISALHRQKRTSRFVVVCPSSLVGNWEREFDKWLGKVGLPKRVVVRKGGEEGLSRLRAFHAIKPGNPSEVLIVSYDLFRTKAAILEKVRGVALLVVDEGHRLKNTAGSLTMTALESLPCEARLCITATPLQNNLGDVYTIATFVCPGVLGDLPTFRREYERPIKAASRKNPTAEQKRAGREASRVLEGILGSILLRRLQRDVLRKSLPPKSTVLLFCRPTREQRELYETTAGGHAGGGRSTEHLVALSGLRKICTHPGLLAPGDCAGRRSGPGGSGASGKLSVLRRLVEAIRELAPNDKIVVVSNFTSTLALVEETVLGPLELGFLRLDGSLGGPERQPLVDAFNRTSADTNFALTLSSRAGGVGLNVTGANRLVMVDPDWNPATDVQAMARIYREGQKKPCFVYRLFTTGTIEEVILQKQIQKESLATSTVDRARASGKDDGSRLNADELKDCFTLKDEACRCDTRRKMGNWPDYGGAASLADRGCTDPVLLAVAAGEERDGSPVLSFVHVVEEDKEQALRDPTRGGGSRGGDEEKPDTDTNCNSDDDDDDGDCSHGAGEHQKACFESSSSDEEYEFE
ncbi:unnamed protein product [Pseudo-nitzschia multistriata]|uniref:Helicase ATP-binding domain-containing protein n=1 Tax=Pseudo-nitzschia multistriata TaxID=183589 RepID=A0A448ZMW1_9STRA|nr:unnamed protein product [Pseudo-nitzschia multistriata]